MTDKLNKDFLEGYTAGFKEASEYLFKKIEETSPPKKEEILISAEIAEYHKHSKLFYLRNVFGNNNQQMMRSKLENCLKINKRIDFSIVSTIKLINVIKLEDIRPGDLVRCTGDDSWDSSNKEKDWDLMLVDRIEGDDIYLTYWDKYNKLPESAKLIYSNWKHWQVSRPVGKE